MSAPAVIAAYHDLWHVEASFRMSKTDLAARPMFARTRDAIEAHLTIVFAALAIARSIQARTGLALRRVIRQLRPLRSATIAINGTCKPSHPRSAPSSSTSSTPSTAPGNWALRQMSQLRWNARGGHAGADPRSSVTTLLKVLDSPSLQTPASVALAAQSPPSHDPCRGPAAR